MRPNVLIISITISMVASFVFALINPNFTPIDLVNSAETIMLLKLSPADTKGHVTCEVKRVLKGNAKVGDKLILDLTTSPQEEYVKSIKKVLQTIGDEPVLLFVGMDEAGQPASFLNLRAQWFKVDKKDDNRQYELMEVDEKMSGTWAGSSDMLLRIVDYILTDPNPNVPVRVGSSWGDKIKVGSISGKIYKFLPVDIDGKGKLSLFVGAETGDKVYIYDKKAKKFDEISSKLKISTHSTLAVWSDFNGDKLLDIASWSNNGLSILLRQPDGSFGVPIAVKSDAIGNECTGLAMLDVGKSPRAGLVVTSSSGAVLVWLNEDNTFGFKKLTHAGVDVPKLGAASKSLVGDFDGDSIPDIVQLFEKGSIIYKGKQKGEFAEGVSCAVSLGTGRTDAAVGDYDADGMFDIICAAEDRPYLWHNKGNFNFVETLEVCGSLAYISKPGSFSCGTCDINNDGRQDLYLLYSEMGPQIFFNRGFRTFGFCIELCANFETVLTDGDKGQQAGTVADFDGDGAQDFALALLNGEIWVVFRSEEDLNLHVLVELPLGGQYIGPVSVRGWHEKRPLGVWNVCAGGDKAFFGVTEPGLCRIEWRFPGKTNQSKEITVEDKPKKTILQ